MQAFFVLFVCVVLPCQGRSKLTPAETQQTPTDELIVALNQGNSHQKIEAAEGLSRRPDVASRSVPVLIRRINDSDIYVRQWAVYALGRLGPAARDAVPMLMASLKHTDFALRTYAAFSISQIAPDQSVQALPVLIESLWTSDPEVQALAAAFIGAIGPAAKDAVPYLAVVVVFNAIDGPRPWVEHTVSAAPAKSPDDKDLPVTFRRPGENAPTGNVRVRYWDFGGAVSPANGARRAALIALGKIGLAARGVSPFLNVTLADPDDAVRMSARDTWKRIHGVVR